MVKKILILAAGKGSRMGELSDHTPKPLVTIYNNIATLDLILDKILACDEIEEVVITVYHLADKLLEYINSLNYPKKITISYDDKWYESGGCLKRALPYMGSDPFYIVNSDVIFHDKEKSVFDILKNSWNPDKMDSLLLLCDEQHTYCGPSGFDFYLGSGGQIYKKSEKNDLYFTGMRIAKPEFFYEVAEEHFSGSIFFNRTIQSDGSLNAVFGVLYDGLWLHIENQKDLARVREFFISKRTKL